MGQKFWRLLRAFAGLCLVAVLLFTVWRFSDSGEPPRSGMHFVLIVPEQGGTREQLQSTVDTLEDSYDLRLELHALPSASEQKRLLRLLPKAGVDGVLLWPISVNDADYAEEMQDLQEAGIPIVVVDRDVQQILRDSFIGSGYKSDLLVLSQSLRSLKNSSSFIVGNRFGGDGGQVVELLFFQRGSGDSLSSAPQDAKLQLLAENPPDGYEAVDCQRVEGANALQLKQLLMGLFSGPQRPKLFFSLDRTLSTASASAKHDLKEDCDVHLLCYGEQSENLSYLESGVVDGLVTSLPEVSITIGIRYLRDICRGFWVPASMDSGITLLTTKELENDFLLVNRDE